MRNPPDCREGMVPPRYPGRPKRKQVSPKRYLAIGISGAFQHTVGMSESDYIIAINLDRNAPIFDVADFGIVGDYREIIPHFYHLLAQASVL